MRQGRVKQVFPGGNTCRGFYSYYDYILPQDEAKRIIVIKGGPGVGKSTFMRKIGDSMVDRGYDVEFMQCSSDNGSLDGIVIPAWKVALIDGTAPHVVDPKNPGCVDEIIHLGDYWDEEGLVSYKEEIMSTNREIGKLFARAYRYLAAAKPFYDDIGIIMDQAVRHGEINKAVQNLISVIFEKMQVSSKVGRERHLFASAITPDGLKNYLPTVVGIQDRVYIIKDSIHAALDRIVSGIAQASVERGLFTEFYHCAFNPEKVEHVVIPDLGVAVTTSNDYHSVSGCVAVEVIEADSFVNDSLVQKYRETISYDRQQFDSLLNKASDLISQAKSLHDEMEAYYVKNMDFDSIESIRVKTLNRILKYSL